MTKSTTKLRQRKQHICGSQNWKCAYCGTRMWDMNAKEDETIFINYQNEFAISMGLPSINSMTKKQLKLFRKMEATLDHIVPKSKGGILREENTVGACVRCNSHKGSDDAEEFIGSLV